MSRRLRSTSKSRQTPINYMGDGSNVMWALHPQMESDAGFHRGADISIISQFAAENEARLRGALCVFVCMCTCTVHVHVHGQVHEPRALPDKKPSVLRAVKTVPL